MIEAPKRFNENPEKATEIKKNGTEAIGIDQDGVAKSIDIEVLMTKDNVGLGDVDNTSDADKPVSTAQQAALNLKETVANVNALKGTGWAGETIKGNATDIQAIHDNIVTDFSGGTSKFAGAVETKELYTLMGAREYGIVFDEITGTTTRTLDAVGMSISVPDGIAPITSDFDNIYPWSEMKHVKINLNGEKREQNAVDYDSFDGEVMTRIPPFWYKDYRENDKRYMSISAKRRAGYTFKKEMYIASFPASKSGSDYQSRIGEAPVTSTSYTNFISGFYAQGDTKWSMYDANVLHSLVLLTCIEAGTMNHKGAYGRGINSGMPYRSSGYDIKANTTDANTVTVGSSLPFYTGMTVQIGTGYTSSNIASDRLITDIVDNGDGTQTLTVDGATFSVAVGNTCVTWGQSVPQAQFDAIGDGSGYILQHESENRSHVCYRGIWDLWGNVWQFAGGFMRYDGQYYGCADISKYNITDPRGAEGWADLGIGGYAANGYQQKRGSVEVEGGAIDVPLLWGGVAGSETYYSAYLYYFTDAYTGARVLLLGGYWGSGVHVSLVYSNGNDSPSSTVIVIGSRLIRS